MTAKQLFSKTTPFIFAKLALGGATVLILAVLLGICLGLGWLFGDTGMVVMFCIWCGAAGVVRFVVMHYFGYLVKAGHIAVIAQACATGRIPENQIEAGKAAVTERFATSNIYFTVDKLVSGAVKQIQSGIGKVGNALDFIPGMEAMTGVAQFFVSIFLGYVDDCCLGWTFYNNRQGACKSAADGVVIYAQNWKTMLKDAAKTMLSVILGTIVVTLLIFIPVGLLFKLLKWSPLIAFLLACLVAWVVKFAVMDSYIMISMMASYMAVAPKTTITFDLYGKLSSISGSFKELLKQSKAEEPVYAGNAPAQQNSNVTKQIPGQPAQNGQKAVFCGQCGTKNAPGTAFCGNCGAKL